MTTLAETTNSGGSWHRASRSYGAGRGPRSGGVPRGYTLTDMRTMMNESISGHHGVLR